MKVSWNWLQSYIDTPVSFDRALELLTDIGLEVEGVETYESIPGSLEGLIVGEVMFVTKHPDADRLTVTRVDTGESELQQIVCGAPNVAAGQKVVVARPGVTIYPINGEPFTLKKAKIRGQESYGMICAEDEIGLSENHEGIMVLDDDLKPGTLLSTVFLLVHDKVIEIGLTPNRADAMAHIGVAHDLLAALRVRDQFKGSLKLPKIKRPVITGTSSNFKVEVADPHKCHRYAGVLIQNLKVSTSPEWLQHRLKAIGLRPINNVVDITNYILHTFGQPLHAFDLEAIRGNGIRVQCLPTDTTFTTLDEQQRKLHEEDLMICDAEDNGMCMAGVFGGIGSGVTDQTTSIFLESACFAPTVIRRTASRHLLFTDASRCFEKGVDPNGVVDALYAAVDLILGLAGGEVASDIYDIYPKPLLPPEVVLRTSRFNLVSGLNLEAEELKQIFEAMEMPVYMLDDDKLKVKVSTGKPDVLREADLIEEALRIYSINRVPLPDILQVPIQSSKHPVSLDVKQDVSAWLCAHHFYEIMGLSLQSSEWYKKWTPDLAEKLVYVNNTSNMHLDTMRASVLLSGLESVSRNLRHQQSDLKFFEFGKTYTTAGENYTEQERLVLIITGSRFGDSWKQNFSENADFFSIKSMVHLLLSRFGISGLKSDSLQDQFFAQGERLMVGKHEIASFGELDTRILKSMDIGQAVFASDINWELLFSLAGKKNQVQFEAWSKYPAVKRDLAIVIDQEVTWETVEKLVEKSVGKLLKEVSIFDVYRNTDHLGAGKKSYAFTVTMQDFEKTLKDTEVEKVMNKLIATLEKEIKSVLRK
jgi:phenylalanyl-tRNA synthetase beta chain